MAILTLAARANLGLLAGQIALVLAVVRGILFGFIAMSGVTSTSSYSMVVTSVEIASE